ncbi:MAG: cupin domain-containing protein [Chloroflexota bacterium]
MSKSRPIDEENAHIGRKIREFRKQRGLTLQMLSGSTSLSVSYLSQMENGRVELNISNLKVISESLDVPLIAFFVNEEPSGVSVMRRQERRWFDLGDNATEALLVKTRANLEIFTIRLSPGAQPTEDDSHQGEEFTYVLNGSVRMVLNDEQAYDLEEGDIIYYLSDIPHRWQNIGEDEAEILVVNTPATF